MRFLDAMGSELRCEGINCSLGFVRWTAQRNFEAVLDVMADGRLDVKPLISHRFDIGGAERAYRYDRGAAPSLGILLHYPTVEEQPEAVLRRWTVAIRRLRRGRSRCAGSTGHPRARLAFHWLRRLSWRC